MAFDMKDFTELGTTNVPEDSPKQWLSGRKDITHTNSIIYRKNDDGSLWYCPVAKYNPDTIHIYPVEKHRLTPEPDTPLYKALS